MRGAFLILTLLGVLVSGFLYNKRMKTVPVAATQAELLGPDGKPVKNLKDLPAAVDKKMHDASAKTDEALKFKDE